MSELRKTRWWRRALLAAIVVIIALPLAALLVLWAGWADNTLRGVVVGQLTRMTGGTIELGQFHFNPWRLQLTVDDLTIHGREPSAAPPFLHIDSLAVQLRVESLWRRKVSLGDVEVSRPAVYVRIAADGSSNVPMPRPAAISTRPLRQRLFDLVVQRLRLVDGIMLFNDARIPLAAEGGGLQFAMDYSNAQGRPSYLGDFTWRQVRVSALRYLPFPADVTARFTLEPDSFSVTQLALALPHTSLDAQFSLASFVRPAWSFRYRGRLDFLDLQTILRNRGIPGGHTDFLGDGQFADGKLALTGRYSAEQIAFHFQWFHAAGITSRGTYHADRRQLEVPDFVAHALGGDVKGRVQLDFKGLLFRTDTHTQAVSLASLLASVDNEQMPVVPLHWNGLVEIQNITTWTANFKNLDSRGVTLWAPLPQPRAGEIPATARINYHYSMAGNNVSFEPSEISTPSSRVEFSGTLGARDSAIAAVFDSQDITPWDDFINRLRGKAAEPKIISGNFHWQGQLTGPIAGPTFAGHVKGSNARYDRLYWDEVEGDMSYSPDGFGFTRARARRGASSAQFEFSLELDDWNFLPEDTWSFDATLVRTETAGLQELLGTSFPLQGLLSGNFHGTGTRADPHVSGLFDIISPQAWGWRLDRARGEFSFDQREISISNAELRLPPPPAPSGTQTALPAGVLTGNFRYGRVDRQTDFNLTGALLPLEGISRIQTARLPIGGQLSFQLNGQGPLLAPKVDGSVRLVNLRLGSEVAGSFAGKLDSDGNRLALQVDSAMAAGALHGQMEVALRGDYPISGEVSVTQLNLNALISSALHLSALTAPSRVDGKFTVSGALLRPETLEVQADLSRIMFDFENVALENTNPVQLAYRRDEIRITRADFRGPDSDFHISGLARFAGDRQLGLQVSGAFNLRLLAGLVPRLEAVGPGQIDASIFGTLSNPRVTGRTHVDGASLRYGDFPAGLSSVTGDFVFDANRMVFDNVSAEVGGGKMLLGGALSYNGPPRYDVTARAEQVRIRYPVGMSWHADATLRLTGTAQAATLSGRVTVDRLLMSDAVDLSSLLGASQKAESFSLESSAFLRNLDLDIQTSTTPNAVLEWPAGNFQAESNLRLRGTWANPILLGNIHLLGGYMEFRGDRYQLSRGDINFENPFRLDPVLNIEVTTRVQQYEITVNFSGEASHLTMSYRSEPPLPSSDVVTLLALGQTGQESALRGLNGAQTPQVGATALLSEAFSSQLGGRIQRLFGISHFSVDPFLAGSTTPSQSAAARVTVEQHFSPDLTVTYVTNVGGTQQQVIQIEYAVRRDISVIALRDDTGTFGIDVIFRKYFK